MRRKIPNRELHRLTPQAFKESPRLPVVLVLDNVRSRHNIGSAFRTSDAFALEHVYLCGITSCPPSPEIHKSALGAEDTMEWTYTKQTVDAVRTLQAKGYKVWTVEQTEGAEKLSSLTSKDWPVTQKTAFVFGHEVRGVQQEVVNLCDGCIEIPQHGTKHSLNVSVAIGVVLWHVYLTMRVW